MTRQQEQRRARAQRKAERLQRQAQAQHEAARSETAAIPAGQPVLRGHSSERKHRAALDRADRKGQKALRTSEAADRAEDRAHRAGRDIRSDDPEALDALRERLANTERRRENVKRINREARKIGDAQVPAYVLQNIGGEIRRLKQRIAELEAAAEHPGGTLYSGDGWTVEDDAYDHRIRIYFDAKPDRQTRDLCKRNGFKWARSVGAWQRQRNNAGRVAAERVANALGGES